MKRLVEMNMLEIGNFILDIESKIAGLKNINMDIINTPYEKKVKTEYESVIGNIFKYIPAGDWRSYRLIKGKKSEYSKYIPIVVTRSIESYSEFLVDAYRRLEKLKQSEVESLKLKEYEQFFNTIDPSEYSFMGNRERECFIHLVLSGYITKQNISEYI